MLVGCLEPVCMCVGGFRLALTQGTGTESIPCMDFSIHHLLLHLKWVTIYAHQAARAGAAGNVWTAHDKEETSAKMNSSTSVMLTKLRMFTRNLLFKCVDSFHIHELRLPCSGSCVNSSPKPQLSITGQWLEFQSNTGALKLNREASIMQRCNNTDNVLNTDCQTFNIYHSLLRLVHELHQRKESIHI